MIRGFYKQNRRLIQTYYEHGVPVTLHIKTEAQVSNSGWYITKGSVTVPNVLTPKGNLRKIRLLSLENFNPLCSFYAGLLNALMCIDEEKVKDIWRNNPAIQQSAIKCSTAFTDSRGHRVHAYKSPILPFISFRIGLSGNISTVEWESELHAFLFYSEKLTAEQQTQLVQRQQYLNDNMTMQKLLDLSGIQQGSFVRNGDSLDIQFTICKG